MQDEKIWIHLLFLACSYSKSAHFGQAEDIWRFKQRTNLANHVEKADEIDVDEQIVQIKDVSSQDLFILTELLLCWST